MVESDPVILFWTAPPEALFDRKTVAQVLRVSVAKLERDAWQGRGVKYMKIDGRVLHRKSAVLDVIKAAEEAA